MNSEYEELKETKYELKSSFLLMGSLFFVLSFFLEKSISMGVYMAIISILPFMSKRFSTMLNKIRSKIFRKNQI